MYSLPIESENGNIEYKLKLIATDKQRLEELATQLRYRLEEKGGEAIYILGVSNDGKLIGLNDYELSESLKILNLVASIAGAKVSLIRRAKGQRGEILELLIRRYKEYIPISVSIIAMGQADHGKTTTIGALITGEADDGDGLLMSKIARFKHEIQMRRTSSVTERYLGFDGHGNIVNYIVPSPLDEAVIFLNSSKIISFIDVGGHERYLRSAAKGLLSHMPDYAMVVVSANSGLSTMTREHLGLALSFKIPIFIVVSKVDLVPENTVYKVIESISDILKMPGISKIPIIIRNMDDAILAAKNITSGRIAPIVMISNKTGYGLNLLRVFLNLLPPRLRWSENLNKPFMLYIDEKFNVPGVGIVVAGLILQGTIHEGDYVHIGPLKDSTFKLIRIKSIQVRRGVFVNSIGAGITAAFALHGISYNEVEKGMVLLDRNMKPAAVKRFKANIFILHHPTTIRKGYVSTFHIYSIKQAGRIIDMDKEPLRTGDKAAITVEVLYKPIYVMPGQKILFREGRTRGIGVISEVC